MKRVGGLWETVVSFANLHEAARRAALGKRKRPDVAAFLLNAEAELVSLRRELESGEYRTGPYREFRVHEAKPRLISAAPFRDRVVHHALTQVLEPIFERRFSKDSYACRVGMGTHKALERAKWAAARFPYVLKCDVRKYFASIDHQILKLLLEKVVKCRPHFAWRTASSMDRTSRKKRSIIFRATTSFRHSNAGAACPLAIKPRNSWRTST